MSEISTYKLIKEKLQAIPNKRLKGSWFEKVSKRFLKEHDSADEYESIDLWSDWELRGKEGDRGIDMVITTTSKEYIAVQCKFHQDSVSLNDLSTFLSKLQSGVGEIGFKKGIIISTSNLSSNALEEIEQIRKSKGIDIVEISEEDFIYSQIDWEKFDPTQTQGELPLCDKKKPRPHQIEAIKATKEYFSDPKNTRGKLIMACGTGKTYTSLKIMEALDPKITLFLAPSIALLSQTFREYAQEKSDPFYASIVCSDDKVGKGKKNKNDDDTDDINFSELPYNNHIAITKIPKKAFDYALNGKSAIDWVIERYKKTTDKDSLIENNPNDYKGGKYVFELLCRVIKLSEKSVDLIEKISEKRFE